MKRKDNTEMVCFRCPVELSKRLERMAKKGDISKSKLILNVCQSSLDTLEACEKVGLLQFTLLVRDMQDYLKDWALNMREKKLF